MIHKRTPSDFARWAALPMAQTSRIEGRLKMILDPHRCKRAVLTRRALLTALFLSGVICLSLAMLHPEARAQEAAPSMSSPIPAMTPVGLPIELTGVTEATVPGGKWWNSAGIIVPAPVFMSNMSKLIGSWTKFTTQPGQRGLFFTFRLPAPAKEATVDYEVSDETLGGIGFSSQATSPGKGPVQTWWMSDSEFVMQTGNDCLLGAAMPSALIKTNIRLGIAAGPWKPAATIKLHPGATAYFLESIGNDKYMLDSLQITKKGIQLDALAKGHADRRAIAIDTHGRRLPALEVSNSSVSDHDKIFARFALRPARIKAILIETRPYQWTEFKDIALQPNGSQASTPADPSPAAPDPNAIARLRQIYGFIQTYRRTHGNAFPATNPPGLMADMAAHPQVYGLPDRSAGNAAQALHFFTSPDSQFMDGGSKAEADKLIVYFLHNKRPDGTLVGTAKRARTQDVFAYTGLYFRNHPDRPSGFYMVLWDNGTVERIPADRALAVPAYDVIGDAKEAKRDGIKQIAFPGQAGLPTN